MYRTQLRSAFFYKGKEIAMSGLPKKPILLCNATLNNFSSEPYETPKFYPFVFSQDYAGSRIIKPNQDPRYVGASYAMAVSGAAVSVNLGSFDKVVSSWPFRLALTILSVNLGSFFRFYRTKYHFAVYCTVFVFSCIYNILLAVFFIAKFVYYHIGGGIDASVGKWATEGLQSMIIIGVVLPPVIFILTTFIPIGHSLNCIRGLLMQDLPIWLSISEVIGIPQTVGSRCLFLSDGGHFDNLGLYTLLEEQCTDILSFDAGEDRDVSLKDLYSCLSMAKDRNIITSIRDVLDYNNLSPNSDPENTFVRTNKNFIDIHVTYPNGSIGKIIYGKSTLSCDEEFLVKLYARNDPNFPYTSTADQFFTKSMFDAYVGLGRTVGSDVLRRYNHEPRQHRPRVLVLNDHVQISTRNANGGGSDGQAANQPQIKLQYENERVYWHTLNGTFEDLLAFVRAKHNNPRLVIVLENAQVLDMTTLKNNIEKLFIVTE
ncbi:GTPase Der [Acrasis kona]|uniref:GTPase Der n=1 Tax=Acrasis kona TaxID=1008807 RepID=A0AAW2Z1K3_9EUKA